MGVAQHTGQGSGNLSEVPCDIWSQHQALESYRYKLYLSTGGFCWEFFIKAKLMTRGKAHVLTLHSILFFIRD